MRKKFFVGMIFGLSTILIVADKSTPLVVWTDGGDVGVWQNGKTTYIPVGDVVFVYLSPNGEQIALVRGTYPYPERLSVVSLAGDNRRDIQLSAYPRQVIWQSETVLWVNNFASLDGFLGLPYGDMLYRINLDTGDITSWDMGELFMMTINSSRDWLALSFAGVYQVSEGRISLLSLTQENPKLQDVLRFRAISSGSHIGYFPTLQWINDEVIRTSIAEPDAFYVLNERASLTQLWQLDVMGISTLLGEVHASLYPVPQWSHDGEWFAYVDISQSEYTLAIAHENGSNVVAQNVTAHLAMLLAIPNDTDFLYLDRQMSLKRYGINRDSASIWITTQDGIIGDLLLYPTGGVMLILEEDDICLGYAYWDDNRVYNIAKLSQYPALDAKWD